MKDIHSFEPLWGVWKIDKLLGEGGFGKVYRAVRRDHGAEYWSAIKHISIPASEGELQAIYSEGYASDERSARKYYEKMLEDIQQEIQFMDRLKGNTNIVAYEDHMDIPKQDMPGYDLFIRMELLHGVHELVSAGKMTTAEVCKLGIDICRALELLEKEKIVHRDIKPANILRNSMGNYKLGDFGIARKLNHTHTVMSKKGTPIYMSPEVFKGEEADIRADIYSLGLVMHRLLNNNKAPFVSADATGIMTYIQQDEAIMRRMRGERIPAPANADAALAEIIGIACEFRPNDRFRTAASFRRALEGYLKNELLSDGTSKHVTDKGETPEEEPTEDIFSGTSGEKPKPDTHEPNPDYIAAFIRNIKIPADADLLEYLAFRTMLAWYEEKIKAEAAGEAAPVIYVSKNEISDIIKRAAAFNHVLKEAALPDTVFRVIAKEYGKAHRETTKPKPEDPTIEEEAKEREAFRTLMEGYYKGRLIPEVRQLAENSGGFNGTIRESGPSPIISEREIAEIIAAAKNGGPKDPCIPIEEMADITRKANSYNMKNHCLCEDDFWAAERVFRKYRMYINISDKAEDDKYEPEPEPEPAGRLSKLIKQILMVGALAAAAVILIFAVRSEHNKDEGTQYITVGDLTDEEVYEANGSTFVQIEGPTATPEITPVPSKEKKLARSVYCAIEDGAVVKAEAGVMSEDIGSLSLGERVYVVREVGDQWYEILYGERTAYVLGQFIKPIAAVNKYNPVSAFITEDNIHMRAEAASNAEKICALNKGDRVAFIKDAGNGYSMIEYDCKIAYVASQYLNIVEEQARVLPEIVEEQAEASTEGVSYIGYTTYDGVNVKADSDYFAPEVGKLGLCEKIYITRKVDYGYYIIYEGKERYVGPTYVEIIADVNDYMPIPATVLYDIDALPATAAVSKKYPLKAGTSVEFIEHRDDGWAMVEYDGMILLVHSQSLNI